MHLIQKYFLFYLHVRGTFYSTVNFNVILLLFNCLFFFISVYFSQNLFEGALK